MSEKKKKVSKLPEKEGKFSDGVCLFVLFGDESKIYSKLIIKEMRFWRK